jgi:hypothetical protein
MSFPVAIMAGCRSFRNMNSFVFYQDITTPMKNTLEIQCKEQNNFLDCSVAVVARHLEEI